MPLVVIDASNAEQHAGGFLGNGGFYTREIVTLKGYPHRGHSHWIDHVHNHLRGCKRVVWHHETNLEDAGEYLLLVPCKIEIRANYWHTFEAVDGDAVGECWFSKAEADRVYGVGADVPWHLEKPDRLIGA